MSNPHGSFLWYELLTKDPAAAKAFYDDVVGWNIDAEPAMEGMDYRMIVAHDGNVGGVMGLNAEMIAGGAQPMWLAYFTADDVDATVAAIVEAGGQVHLPAFDVPDVGRLAMVTDPQGVPFYVMRGAVEGETSNAYDRGNLGHVSWNELNTPDPDAALAFYEKQFGIRKVGAMPMGEQGEYSFIAHGESDEPIGAVMRTPEGAPSGWGFYFRVPDIQAAKAKILGAGGTVHFEPMEVPGGEWVLSAQDPEGVHFGLVAPPQG